METAALRELKERFARSFMDVLALRLLEREGMWGYRLASRIEETYGVRVGPSVIYPLLRDLEERGLVEGREERIGGRRRRIYEVTERGREFLEEYMELLRRQLDSSDLTP